MDPAKRKRLEAAGFVVVDDAADWLGLTAEERALIDLRLALTRTIGRLRDEQRLTRRQMAAKLKTTPSQVAKIEVGVDVTLDRLFRTLFALGGRLADLDVPAPPKKAAHRPKARKGKVAAP